jgi:undecaprenyl-diphosphatase
MTYLEAAFLGFVQGATEFLPISSDGHLKLAERWLGFEKANLAFDVALHAGTLLTVVVAFWKDILLALRDRKLALAIVVATLPLIPVGLFAKPFIEQTLDTVAATAVGFLITAAFLFAASRFDRGTRTLSEIRLRDALVVGAFQAIAPAPGISRSGSTIFGGLVAGLSRDSAARFSFLIAIPAVGGALVLHAKELWKNEGGRVDPGPTIVGAMVSFIVGLIAVRVLIALVVRRQLRGFGWYCLLLGVTLLVAPFLAR